MKEIHGFPKYDMHLSAYLAIVDSNRKTLTDWYCVTRSSKQFSLLKFNPRIKVEDRMQGGKLYFFLVTCPSPTTTEGRKKLPFSCGRRCQLAILQQGQSRSFTRPYHGDIYKLYLFVMYMWMSTCVTINKVALIQAHPVADLSSLADFSHTVSNLYSQTLIYHDYNHISILCR